ALVDLVRAGKIRYFGVSNYRAWRVAELHRPAREAGIDGPLVSQPYYNAMNRMPEVEHLPACAYFGMGVVPYSPLARGVLTARYARAWAPPADTRAGREDRRMMQTEWRRESLELRRSSATPKRAESRPASSHAQKPKPLSAYGIDKNVADRARKTGALPEQTARWRRDIVPFTRQPSHGRATCLSPSDDGN